MEKKKEQKAVSKFASQSQKFSIFLERQMELGRAGQCFPNSFFGSCFTVIIADLTFILFEFIAKI